MVYFVCVWFSFYVFCLFGVGFIDLFWIVCFVDEFGFVVCWVDWVCWVWCGIGVGWING